MKHDPETRILRKLAFTKLPTKWGEFRAVGFQQEICNGSRRFESAMALIMGEPAANATVPLVRIHSQCLTGETLGSLRCDCGEQLHKAMQMVEKEGVGAILYMNQEGRGIGLVNKLKAYKLQENGMDTVEANLHLGFPMDQRDYGVGAQILRYLGISKLRLISNNPRKRAGLLGYGLEIVETVPIEIHPNPHNEKYLQTKRDKLGHEILAISPKGSLE